jgi:hypothetical protein
MSFVFPWLMVLGTAVAAGVVALHLLSTRRPPVRPLPTARFVPPSDLRAVSRTSQPTDLLLLALRVLAVLLIAAAFAQPIPDAPGPALRRVVALEWTTALADAEAARTRARTLLGEGDALVVFDTAARMLPAADLAALPMPTVRAAALSPMLVAVRDAAGTIARGADSLAVTVLSGFPLDAWDAATLPLRATWPGRIELQVLASAVDSGVPLVAVLAADANDPVVAAVPLVGGGSAARSVRLRRGLATDAGAASPAADSAWLAQTSGGVLVQWLRDTTAVVAADGVVALLGAEVALVAPLGRGALGTGDATPAVRVIARWRDGTPAATERAEGVGCRRDVAIAVSDRGDVTLREPFAALLRVLLEPCGGKRWAAPHDSVLAEFAGRGALARAGPLVRDGAGSPSTPWLLVAALLLLLAEQWWRQRSAAEAAQ